jgi:hypothetical protein
VRQFSNLWWHDEEAHETDLFAALKGGGNNFGIVTQYTLQTQPISDKVGNTPAFNLMNAANV